MTPPFASVLVANRGEIACRIFRTARAMGMRAIAVYSDADAKAKHVREADEAIHIGPAAAGESYLRGEKILAAAKQSGAAAVHPGYGFLSENPEFAEAVVAAGLIWIGPTPASIRAMGLKDEAKRIAIAAGVPVLPGYQGEDQSEKLLLDEAKAIGFPVLIKAVAGGGGRGIREVGAAKDFKDQLASARREAKAAFGDDRVLIEKLVARPRHIEVQVFGDKHGGLVHLFERDCSLQRRRQKVIEEAPAPGMTDEVRAAMTDAALKVARAVDYENAGTVEFIVDGEGPLRPDGFWFLEMNTRLQVEHPVTEAITGLDLVEWQFRVAAGEKLPKKQDEIAINGHAIEARICAEDPGEGFRPSVGKIERFTTLWRPRLDTGFEAGDVISPHYDSMIAKLIESQRKDLGSRTREANCHMLAANLGQLEFDGPKTNIGFLIRCLADESFLEGRVHTGIIADNLDTLVDGSKDRTAAAVFAALDDLRANRGDVWGAADGWRLNAAASAEWHWKDSVGPIRVRLTREGPDWMALVDGESKRVSKVHYGRSSIEAEFDKELSIARIVCGASKVVVVGGEHFQFDSIGVGADLAAVGGGDTIIAPLPGKIVSLVTKPGVTVKKGDPLLTLEAMKMEHALKAPRDGVVAEVTVAEGAQVKEAEVLVRLEALEAPP